MSGEIKACEVKDWGKGQETWKPGWFYGLTEHLSGDRLVMRAVVRFPGSLLLEDVQLSDVRLTEDSPAPNPADEAEVEETHPQPPFEVPISVLQALGEEGE